MKEGVLVYLFAVLLVLQQHKTPNTLISEPPALDSHQKLENCSLVREVGWSLYKAGPYVHEVLVKLGRRWLGSGNLVLVMGPGRMVSVSRGTQFAKGVHCSPRRQKKECWGSTIMDITFPFSLCSFIPPARSKWCWKLCKQKLLRFRIWRKYPRWKGQQCLSCFSGKEMA